MIKERGFSLLEMLIAFSILALSLTLLLKIFSTGTSTAMLAEDYSTATQLAESLMARTGVEMPLQLGEQTGVTEDKYNWRVTISPFAVALGEMEMKTLPVDLFKIKVTVSWQGNGVDDRVLELTSLRLANKLL